MRQLPITIGTIYTIRLEKENWHFGDPGLSSCADFSIWRAAQNLHKLIETSILRNLKVISFFFHGHSTSGLKKL
jgi:hypothetical protein